MLKQGKAYRIFLSKQIAEQMTNGTGRKYNEGDELILCKVGHQCLYEGREIKDANIEGHNVTAYICELAKKTKLEKVLINN